MNTEIVELRGGKREGAGRPKKLKTQVKDWIAAHPLAVAELMQVLFEKGIEGDRECAMYVIDRIKGKPKATLGIDEEDRELLTAATVLEFRKMVDRKQLTEGEYGQESEGKDEAVQG